MPQFLPMRSRRVASGKPAPIGGGGGGTIPDDGGGETGGGGTTPPPATLAILAYRNPKLLLQEGYERNKWGRPATADHILKITNVPTTEWVGGYGGGAAGDYTVEINKVKGLKAAAAAASTSVLTVLFTIVIYGLPNRDNGQASAGGLGDNTRYFAWIRAMAAAIGNAPCIVVIEPDGTGLGVDPGPQAQRYAAMAGAVNIIADACPNARIFLDSANPGWKTAATMISRLKASGVNLRRLAGITCNISNFRTTAECHAFCEAIIAGLTAQNPDLEYIVDTGRNGNGPGGGTNLDPKGRALGARPAIRPEPSAHPKCFAFLWIKCPGGADAGFSGAIRAWTKVIGGVLTQVYSGNAGDCFTDRLVEMSQNDPFD